MAIPNTLNKVLSIFLSAVFFLQSTGLAQGVPLNSAAGGSFLPVPGTMVGLSETAQPPVLKGLKVYADEPFRFDFIMDKGDHNSAESASSDSGRQAPNELNFEANKLIRYFLASLTVPEKDLWVNLSPYEKDRIITNEFGQTEMGRDLLAQDYLLKQLTASVIYPEGETGKKFWAEVYRKAYEKYGTTDIPVDTFNKVWIVPEKAVVYEKTAENQPSATTTQGAQSSVAYVVNAKLKVMLESDYLASAKSGSCASAADCQQPAAPVSESQELGKQVLRDIVIPVLEHEVNEGANFAQLRQVYNSLILAAWYKRKVKASLLSAVYVDRKKMQGIDVKSQASDVGNQTLDPEVIWSQYVQAFKKGAYNYIKEEQDRYTGETVPRKYFSGGARFDMAQALSVTHDFATIPSPKNVILLHTDITPSDRAMSFRLPMKSPNNAVIDRAMKVSDFAKPVHLSGDAAREYLRSYIGSIPNLQKMRFPEEVEDLHGLKFDEDLEKIALSSNSDDTFTALDIGAGVGFGLFAIHNEMTLPYNQGRHKKRNVEVHGYELEGYVHDQEDSPILWHYGKTAETLPADWTNRFSVVLSTRVADYMYDPLRSVEEMHRVLKPGGMASVAFRLINQFEYPKLVRNLASKKTEQQKNAIGAVYWQGFNVYEEVQKLKASGHEIELAIPISYQDYSPVQKALGEDYPLIDKVKSQLHRVSDQMGAFYLPVDRTIWDKMQSSEGFPVKTLVLRIGKKSADEKLSFPYHVDYLENPLMRHFVPDAVPTADRAMNDDRFRGEDKGRRPYDRKLVMSRTAQMHFFGLYSEQEMSLRAIISGDYEMMSALAQLPAGHEVFMIGGGESVYTQPIKEGLQVALGAAFEKEVNGFVMALPDTLLNGTVEEQARYLGHELGHIALYYHRQKTSPEKNAALDRLDARLSLVDNPIPEKVYQHFYDFTVTKFQLEQGWNASAEGYLRHVVEMSKTFLSSGQEYDYVQAVFEYAVYYIAAPLAWEQARPERAREMRQELGRLFNIDESDLPRIHAIINEHVLPYLQDGTWMEPKTFFEREADMVRTIAKNFNRPTDRAMKTSQQPLPDFIPVKEDSPEAELLSDEIIGTGIMSHGGDLRIGDDLGKLVDGLGIKYGSPLLSDLDRYLGKAMGLFNRWLNGTAHLGPWIEIVSLKNRQAAYIADAEERMRLRGLHDLPLAVNEKYTEISGKFAEMETVLDGLQELSHDARKVFPDDTSASLYQSKLEQGLTSFVGQYRPYVRAVRAFFSSSGELAAESLSDIPDLGGWLERQSFVTKAWDEQHGEISQEVAFNLKKTSAKFPIRAHSDLLRMALARISSNGFHADNEVAAKGMKVVLSDGERSGRPYALIKFFNKGTIPMEFLERADASPDSPQKLFKWDFHFDYLKYNRQGFGVKFAARAIEKMGGFVEAENTTLNGEPYAVVTVYLPVADQAQASPDKVETTPDRAMADKRPAVVPLDQLAGRVRERVANKGIHQIQCWSARVSKDSWNAFDHYYLISPDTDLGLAILPSIIRRAQSEAEGTVFELSSEKGVLTVRAIPPQALDTSKESGESAVDRAMRTDGGEDLRELLKRDPNALKGMSQVQIAKLLGLTQPGAKWSLDQAGFKTPGVLSRERVDAFAAWVLGWMKEYRGEELPWTERELAKAFGISQSTVHRKIQESRDTLGELADQAMSVKKGGAVGQPAPLRNRYDRKINGFERKILPYFEGMPYWVKRSTRSVFSSYGHSFIDRHHLEDMEWDMPDRISIEKNRQAAYAALDKLTGSGWEQKSAESLLVGFARSSGSASASTFAELEGFIDAARLAGFSLEQMDGVLRQSSAMQRDFPKEVLEYSAGLVRELSSRKASAQKIHAFLVLIWSAVGPGGVEKNISTLLYLMKQFPGASPEEIFDSVGPLFQKWKWYTYEILYRPERMSGTQGMRLSSALRHAETEMVAQMQTTPEQLKPVDTSFDERLDGTITFFAEHGFQRPIHALAAIVKSVLDTAPRNGQTATRETLEAALGLAEDILRVVSGEKKFEDLPKPALEDSYIKAVDERMGSLIDHERRYQNDPLFYGRIGNRFFPQDYLDLVKNIREKPAQFAKWLSKQPVDKARYPKVSAKTYKSISSAEQRLVDMLQDPARLRLFLKAVTLLRMAFPYDSAFGNGSTPLEYAKKEGLIFSLMDGIRISPTTQSFRRHLVGVTGADGQEIWFEVKIPGRDEGRDQIFENTMDVAKEYQEAFPDHQDDVAPPVALLTTAGTVEDFYGFPAKFPAREPLRVALFGDDDGNRLVHLETIVRPDGVFSSSRAIIDEFFHKRFVKDLVRSEALEKLQQQLKDSGSQEPLRAPIELALKISSDPKYWTITPEYKAFLQGIALQVMRIGLRFLELGYRGYNEHATDWHLENFRLLLSGKVQAVSDFNVFEKEPVPRTEWKAEIQKLFGYGAGYLQGDFDALYEQALAAHDQEMEVARQRAGATASSLDSAMVQPPGNAMTRREALVVPIALTLSRALFGGRPVGVTLTPAMRRAAAELFRRVLLSNESLQNLDSRLLAQAVGSGQVQADEEVLRTAIFLRDLFVVEPKGNGPRMSPVLSAKTYLGFSGLLELQKESKKSQEFHSKFEANVDGLARVIGLSGAFIEEAKASTSVLEKGKPVDVSNYRKQFDQYLSGDVNVEGLLALARKLAPMAARDIGDERGVTNTITSDDGSIVFLIVSEPDVLSGEVGHVLIRVVDKKGVLPDFLLETVDSLSQAARKRGEDQLNSSVYKDFFDAVSSGAYHDLVKARIRDAVIVDKWTSGSWNDRESILKEFSEMRVALATRSESLSTGGNVGGISEQPLSSQRTQDARIVKTQVRFDNNLVAHALGGYLAYRCLRLAGSRETALRAFFRVVATPEGKLRPASELPDGPKDFLDKFSALVAEEKVLAKKAGRSAGSPQAAAGFNNVPTPDRAMATGPGNKPGAQSNEEPGHVFQRLVIPDVNSGINSRILRLVPGAGNSIDISVRELEGRRFRIERGMNGKYSVCELRVNGVEEKEVGRTAVNGGIIYVGEPAPTDHFMDVHARPFMNGLERLHFLVRAQNTAVKIENVGYDYMDVSGNFTEDFAQAPADMAEAGEKPEDRLITDQIGRGLVADQAQADETVNRKRMSPEEAYQYAKSAVDGLLSRFGLSYERYDQTSTPFPDEPDIEARFYSMTPLDHAKFVWEASPYSLSVLLATVADSRSDNYFARCLSITLGSLQNGKTAITLERPSFLPSDHALWKLLPHLRELLKNISAETGIPVIDQVFENPEYDQFAVGDILKKTIEATMKEVGLSERLRISWHDTFNELFGLSWADIKTYPDFRRQVTALFVEPRAGSLMKRLAFIQAWSRTLAQRGIIPLSASPSEQDIKEDARRVHEERRARAKQRLDNFTRMKNEERRKIEAQRQEKEIGLILEEINRTEGKAVFTPEVKAQIAAKISTWQLERGKSVLVVGHSGNDYLPVVLEKMGLKVSAIDTYLQRVQEQNALHERFGLGKLIGSFASYDELGERKFDFITALAVINDAVDVTKEGNVSQLLQLQMMSALSGFKNDLDQEIDDVAGRVYDQEIRDFMRPILAHLELNGGTILLNKPGDERFMALFNRQSKKQGFQGLLVYLDRLMPSLGQEMGLRFIPQPQIDVSDVTLHPTWFNEMNRRTGVAYRAEPADRAMGEKAGPQQNVPGVDAELSVQDSENGFFIKDGEPFKIVEGKKDGYFEVVVGGMTFKVLDYYDVENRHFLYFKRLPLTPGDRTRWNFVYVKYQGGAEENPAIRDIFVTRKDRNKGLANFMIRVLLARHPDVGLVHPDTRNALLMKELIQKFGFRPQAGADPNAFYLKRELSDDEIRALGYDPGGFDRRPKVFVSRKTYETFVGALHADLRRQYLAADNLSVIRRDAQAVPLYLGQILYRKRPDIRSVKTGSHLKDTALGSRTGYPMAENFAIPGVEEGDKGGINLNPVDKTLDVDAAQGAAAMKFNIDPAMLKEYQSAPGFVPVIMNIEPLESLPAFLGASEQEKSAAAV